MSGILFLKAALIGLSIAAPVGPVGLLCIQRTLNHGARIGFISGLGAACADACFGMIGAFGVAAVTQAFMTLAQPLALAGSILLAWMGIGLLRAPAAERAATAASAVRALPAFSSVYALTMTNPLTILSFVAVFSALGAGGATGAGQAALMVAGVFIGSASWWLGLALTVTALRHRIGTRVMVAINRAAGLFLLGFALWQLVRVALAPA